jgi:hypothetical protein
MEVAAIMLLLLSAAFLIGWVGGQDYQRANDMHNKCTSDDPTNHQGDTCPVHENE